MGRILQEALNAALIMFIWFVVALLIVLFFSIVVPW